MSDSESSSSAPAEFFSAAAKDANESRERSYRQLQERDATAARIGLVAVRRARQHFVDVCSFACVEKKYYDWVI